jgi:hypothetical protein
MFAMDGGLIEKMALRTHVAGASQLTQCRAWAFDDPPTRPKAGWTQIMQKGPRGKEARNQI